eukprot:CAMPEP_0196596718 /NCGR_PEP_ID=MMETSP1081-20130531/87530_1 /TAXON_ID=36882 /ORGANISM="Pyramimonas amylifera, Strain CCMP720" /LENGTH=779 /DNA_ID=CAMNT_0041921845 /DNA_START=110 /DNA_END=2449 /DNA_ORIENTATION=+
MQSSIFLGTKQMLQGSFLGNSPPVISDIKTFLNHNRNFKLHIDSRVTSDTSRSTRGGRDSGGRGGGRGGRGRGRKGGSRLFIRSDGFQHLGTSLKQKKRPFPGPTGRDGPPLRILPIGGLGEIGMNCMLVGNYDRYVLVDAGLMFPDFDELGINKKLPDISFIAQWKDKIEAVFITHGHEDHIGAMPWVIPALDPNTPIYSGGFTMQLIKRRMMEYNLWNPNRFITVKNGDRFQAGPFELEPIRVTHSIPDCFGCIFRCDDGTIVHTGDWKIDENPVDKQMFDRSAFEEVGKEGVALMMSDSTNVLSPGRTTSEIDVEKNLLRVVQGREGRIIATQFASNLHRLASMKKAADSVSRKLCFMGTSLNTYLEASFRNGTAPFNPSELVDPSDADQMDPTQLLIITTGSQAEPQAMLSTASRGVSKLLHLRPEDTLLYSAKMIPGNEKRVIRMMNKVAEAGTNIVMGAAEGLHTSGHAHYQELQEVLRLTQPQHFLPVHGEVSFLKAHEAMARANGVQHTAVIQNGIMIGFGDRRNNKEFSTTRVPQNRVPNPEDYMGEPEEDEEAKEGRGGVAPKFSRIAVSSGDIQILGEVELSDMYNDGNNGTGNRQEMVVDERMALATEGIVIAAVEVIRPPPNSRKLEGEPEAGLQGVVRITTRGMWNNEGKLLRELQREAEVSLSHIARNATIVFIERAISVQLRKTVKRSCKKRPDVICIAHESLESLAPGAASAGGLSRGIVPSTQAPGLERQNRSGGRNSSGGRRGRGRSSLDKNDRFTNESD